MAKKIDWAVSIDKLRVCYNMSSDLYVYLRDNYTRKNDNGNRILYEDYFYFLFIEEDDDSMTAIVNVKDESHTYFKLGTFVFNNGKRYENKAFFTFDNSALYRIYTKAPDNISKNHICDLQYIAGYFGLEFNNITKLEIAFDSNFNFIKKTRKLIKDIENYDLYINGRKMKENETLPNYGEFYSRTREKLSLAPTLYFSQAKATDLEMRIYDKDEELDENTPYKRAKLEEWLGWSDMSKIYRVEVVMHNTNVREFVSRYIEKMYEEMGGHANILDLLNLRDFRLAMFLDCCDRLIYFKEKKTGKKISIAELAGI